MIYKPHPPTPSPLAARGSKKFSPFLIAEKGDRWMRFSSYPLSVDGEGNIRGEVKNRFDSHNSSCYNNPVIARYEQHFKN
jgi:hypothetical protein